MYRRLDRWIWHYESKKAVCGSKADFELVEAARAGNLSSFTELCQRHYAPLVVIRHWAFR
jgi:hypothetical protein